MTNETTVDKNLAETRTAIRKAVDLYLNNANQVDPELLAEHLYESLSDEFDRLYRIEEGVATLAERYEAVVAKAPRHPRWLYIDPLTLGQRAEHDRAVGYRNAARALRELTHTGRLSDDLTDASELDQLDTD